MISNTWIGWPFRNTQATETENKKLQKGNDRSNKNYIFSIHFSLVGI